VPTLPCRTPRRRTVSRRTTVAAMLIGLAAPLLSAATPALASDDYAYRYDRTQTADPWGFTKRQCVSFAAFRLAQHGHPLRNSTQHWGDAHHWDDTAVASHFRVTTRPVVGAVAQWNAYERSAWYANGSQRPNGTLQAGGYGHVAVLSRVYSDGSVQIEQYNMSGLRTWSTMRARAPRYLYIGVR